jgi:cyclopropane-fatty-acyl-phospholipid synthase
MFARGSMPENISISNIETTARKLFKLAGINVDGNNSWDIRVHNKKFYSRVLNEGSLGLGESYMDGWWDCERLDEFFYRILSSKVEKQVRKNQSLLWEVLQARLFNRQSKERAFQIGERHYDLGNELFCQMLGRRMVYSCAYWENETTLDKAQENKLELICRKLGLQAGMKLLDIGCGWGSLVR